MPDPRQSVTRASFQIRAVKWHAYWPVACPLEMNREEVATRILKSHDFSAAYLRRCTADDKTMQLNHATE